MNTTSTTGDFASRLGQLDCCAVSDALDKLKLTGVVGGLSQLAASRRIAGQVLTVKLGAAAASTGAAPAKPRHLCAAAIELAEPGNIIVVEQRTGIVAGSWGGILTLAAKVRGVAGVISDGLVRDLDEAREHDFPVYARGVTPLTARSRVSEIATNEPVKIGDVEVRAGDYAIADGTGVIFVTPENIERVLETAEGIAAKEAAMTQALLSGERVSEVMGANYEHMLRQPPGASGH